MSVAAIKDKTAIAGIGWSRFSRDSGTTVMNLALEASLMAIGDAGLQPKDIDGVVTYYWRPDTPGPREFSEALGLDGCNYEDFAQLGGGWADAAVLSAAMAVHSGLCKNVLVFRAMNGRSQRRPTRAGGGESGGAAQFTAPYGVVHAAANIGHYATAHMAKFGTTTLDFAHLSVTQRKNASLNNKAVMRELMTIDDHQNSRWIVYPYRLLDCCLDTDGAVAMVVTSAENAAVDMPQAPVYIMSGTAGSRPSPNPWTTGGALAAPFLYEGAGITPGDVDIAELYDPFSFQCMLHMEDFGIAPKGEVGPWVTAGNNALDGTVPVNTHGGMLSEAYVQGLNHVIEAVQQLRPGGVIDDLCTGPHTYDRSTCRQVKDPTIALCCAENGGSSLLLRKAD